MVGDSKLPGSFVLVVTIEGGVGTPALLSYFLNNGLVQFIVFSFPLSISMVLCREAVDQER